MTSLSRSYRQSAKPATRRLIDRMVRRIVAEFDPEQVILFGSHARGQARADSDVDLLVVMRYCGSSARARTAIRLALDDFPIAKDIVVATPEEFAWRCRVPGTVERPAALEGEVLHARS